MEKNSVVENGHTILFKSSEHKRFYQETLLKCRCQDVYHKALVYCLGIDWDTRHRAEQIFDFNSGFVKPECLQEGWQTGGSQKIIRMAFNLYCNGTPSIYEYEDKEGQLRECRKYTAEELFCCSYARYFWEAIKIRYPEQCIDEGGAD